MEDDVETVALGNYGAYFSAIDTEVVVQVTKLHPNVTVETLVEPMGLRVAVNGTPKTPLEFTASKKITMWITIHVMDTNLPVRIRGLKVLVVDQNMDEISLGRPFLRAIWFDLQNNLVHSGKRLNNKHLK